MSVIQHSLLVCIIILILKSVLTGAGSDPFTGIAQMLEEFHTTAYDRLKYLYITAQMQSQASITPSHSI